MESRRAHPIRAGLLAGSVAAAANALVSLPLHSPDDALLNSATVVIATLGAGLAGGLLWRRIGARKAAVRLFAVAVTAGGALVVALIVAGETLLDRSISFGLPLAAIAFLGVAVVPRLARDNIGAGRLPFLILLVAIALGAGLANLGDQRSGRLELPPRSAPINSG